MLLNFKAQIGFRLGLDFGFESLNVIREPALICGWKQVWVRQVSIGLGCALCVVRIILAQPEPNPFLIWCENINPS